MQDKIKSDILDWLINFVEANHSFYNFKFPPCPYAKAARLKGLVDIKVYETGSVRNYIVDQTETTNIRILVFPPQVQWYFGIKRFINKLNESLILKNQYAQYGKAISTKSKYPGILKNTPYFIVIINNLSDVLDGQEALSKTDYYKNWTKKHFNAVVVRRQDQVSKIKG
jgi:hypothetical protein